jgi:putative phosphonate metabolism protein
MRYAIYFIPEENDPLQRMAARWLGRDPFSGSAVEAPAVASLSPGEIAFHTASARRYGFHATLKAPFRLAENQTEAGLQSALDSFAQNAGPVTIPRLAIGRIDGFFALIPAMPLPELDRFAGEVVREFDRFRAPLSEAEIERRSPDALSAQEFSNLCQWGYPYVFDAFRFHMTLTGRVGAGEADRVRAALDEVFTPLLGSPVAVDGLGLFVEREPGAPFVVESWHRVGRRADRKSA